MFQHVQIKNTVESALQEHQVNSNFNGEPVILLCVRDGYGLILKHPKSLEGWIVDLRQRLGRMHKDFRPLPSYVSPKKYYLNKDRFDFKQIARRIQFKILYPRDIAW